MTRLMCKSYWSAVVIGLGSLMGLVGTVPQAQAASFYYDDFQSLAGLNLVGDTVQTGSRLRLTQAGQEWQAGATWFDQAQTLHYGFETSFQFQISEPRSRDNLRDGQSVVDRNGHTGGDGFAFVLRNSTASALGNWGGGLGYSGIGQSLAIEFDTWDNSDDFIQWGDSKLDNVAGESSNHISVQANNDGAYGEFPRYSLGVTHDIVNLSNGNVHEAKIRYLDGRLSIFLNSLLALSIDNLDLTQIIGEETASIGFTAATGGSWENHDILSWSYQELFPPETSPQLFASRPLPVKTSESTTVLGLFGLVALLKGRSPSTRVASL